MQNRPYLYRMKNVFTYTRSRECVASAGLSMPMLVFFSVFFLTMLFCIMQANKAWAGAVVDVHTISPQLSTQDTMQPALGPWKNQDTHESSQDKLWKQGKSAHDLMRQKSTATSSPQVNAAHGNVGMGPHPSALPKAEQEEGVVLAGGAIEGNAEVVGSSWHGPGSEEPIIDEDMLKEQHDVVGAYGQVVAEDNFKMSVGPELYIPGNSASLLGSEDKDASELGMGMKFQWGF